MDHRLNGIGGKQAIEQRAIANIPHHQLGFQNIFGNIPVTVDEIVQDEDIVASRLQALNGVGADISSSTRD